MDIMGMLWDLPMKCRDFIMDIMGFNRQLEIHGDSPSWVSKNGGEIQKCPHGGLVHDGLVGFESSKTRDFPAHVATKDGIFLWFFLVAKIPWGWCSKSPACYDLATIWPLFLGGIVCQTWLANDDFLSNPTSFFPALGVVFMSRGLVRYVRWPSAFTGRLEILEAGLTSWKLGLKHISILLQAILSILGSKTEYQGEVGDQMEL